MTYRLRNDGWACSIVYNDHYRPLLNLYLPMSVRILHPSYGRTALLRQILRFAGLCHLTY